MARILVWSVLVGLWLGTFGGELVRFKDGTSTAFTSHNGLPDNFVWTPRAVSGSAPTGIVKLADRSFSTLSGDEGLSNALARSVLEGRDGAIWIGTQGGGLNRVKDGRVFSVYTTRSGLPASLTYLLY